MKLVYATSVHLKSDTVGAHHVLATSRALMELGHSVELMYPGPLVQNERARPHADKQHLLFYPKMRGGARLMHAQMAARLMTMDRRNIDVLYFRIGPNSTVNRALKHINTPKVLEINGSELVGNPQFSALSHSMDLLLVDSEHLRENYLRVTPIPSDRVKVHMSPALDEHDLLPVSKSRTRADLAIDQSSNVLLHVSGFDPHHDFVTLEHAMRSLLKSDTQRRLVLLMVGDGPVRERVQSSMSDLVDSGHVQFTGRVNRSRLREYIGAADICLNLLAARKLLDGNLRAQKIFDYLGGARPIVEAFDESLPIEDWARDTMYLVPPESPAQLALAVEEILSSLGDWNSRAEVGRQYLLRNRTWKNATETTVAHLERLLAERRGP